MDYEQLKADILLLQDKIQTSINVGESEKLYYQTLALEKLEIMKRNQIQSFSGSNLTLLSPTNATYNDPRLFQNQSYQNRQDHGVSNSFGGPGTYWYHASDHSSPPNNAKGGVKWCHGKGDNDYCILKKYTIGTFYASPRLGSWIIDVSMDSTTGWDGKWTEVDIVNGANPGNSQMVERIIKEPIACRWIRIQIVASTDTANNMVVGTLSFYGTEHFEGA